MLSNLNWETLHYRRYVLKLIMFHVYNLVKVCLPNYINHNTSTTRGPEFKLSISHLQELTPINTAFSSHHTNMEQSTCLSCKIGEH